MGEGVNRVLDVIGRWERETLDLIPTFTKDDAVTRSNMAQRTRTASGVMRDKATSERDELDRAHDAGVPVGRAFKVKVSPKHQPIFDDLAKTPTMTSFSWNRETYYEMRFIE